MHWLKILHQSIMGGCYVGFGGLLALSVAGNMAGSRLSDPGLVKFTFAALFPVNLLLIVMTSGQLFTGNSATVSAAKWEGMVEWRELWKSLFVSLLGNVIGCGAFAYTAHYAGCLTGGTAALAVSTAVSKCAGAFLPTLIKGILCNWMVSLALFMANASNDLPGKMIGCWFPVSTFLGIGLEHSVANLFILPCAMLLGAKLTLRDIVVKNLIPVLLGNFIAGSLVVAASYSYQYRNLGAKSRQRFREQLEVYQARKQAERDAANNVPAAATAAASSSE
jgi:formate transporter